MVPDTNAGPAPVLELGGRRRLITSNSADDVLTLTIRMGCKEPEVYVAGIGGFLATDSRHSHFPILGLEGVACHLSPVHML